MTDYEAAPPWTDEDLGFLAANPDLPGAEAGEILGRSREAVYRMRAKLRRGWAPMKEQWREEDDAFILATPHLTALQVARHLMTTSDRVGHRRKFLAARTGASFGTANKSPHQCGARTLVAKTCLGCGALLQARWFTFNRSKGGHYSSRCVRCKPRSESKREYTPEVYARQERTRQKLQSMTLPAPNANQPYLERDHEVLQDPDLTLIEKALQLGRTYGAVQSVCTRHGYRSKVGLGDPEHGHWIIHNPNVAA